MDISNFIEIVHAYTSIYRKYPRRNIEIGPPETKHMMK